MKKKKDSGKDKLETIAVLFFSIASLFFWESILVTPIKLFVVLIHETSHALTTIFTGGIVESIDFNSYLSGITKTKGGSLILIASSGYLGSLAVGSALFLSVKKEKFRNRLTIILAVILFLVAVNLIESGTAAFLTICAAAFLFFFPRYLPDKIVSPVFKFIGITSCLYVIADIKQDLLTTTLRETDTQILEYLTGIPALAIGTAWFLISLIVVYLILKKEF